MPKSVERRLKKNEGKLARSFTVEIKAEFGNRFQRETFDGAIVSSLKSLKNFFEKSNSKNKIKIEFK
jgi:hypothetical protein